jgi:hypothetical protein
MAATSRQRLAQQYARDWRAAYPEKHSAVCDRCNLEIKRTEGCLVAGDGLDLNCDDCYDGHTPRNYHAYRARLNAMRAMHENKSTPLATAAAVILEILFWIAVIWGAVQFFG